MPRRHGFECSAKGHALVLVALLATGAIALSSDGRVTWAAAAQDTAAPAQVTPGMDCSACTLRHKARLKRRKPTESCRIKGEIGDAGARIYHLPGSDHYERMDIDTTKGERWFCTEAEARAAGWRPDRR